MNRPILAVVVILIGSTLSLPFDRRSVDGYPAPPWAPETEPYPYRRIPQPDLSSDTRVNDILSENARRGGFIRINPDSELIEIDEFGNVVSIGSGTGRGYGEAGRNTLRGRTTPYPNWLGGHQYERGQVQVQIPDPAFQGNFFPY